MLNAIQEKAVRLLMELPEARVAEELGIRLITLRRWKGKKEFAEALRTAGREARDSAARILCNTLAHAAARVHAQVALRADDERSPRPDLKVLVDMFKASGALTSALDGSAQSEDLDDVLAELDEED